MGHKDHIMVQRRLKMHEKRQKMEFLDQKNCFLAEFSSADLGGTPLPLTKKIR